MARSLYGGRLGDTVVSLFTIGTRQVLALPTDQSGAPTSTLLQVYDAPAGAHLTDLLAADSTTPITAVLVPPDGQIPAFYGPDGYGDGLWLLDPEGDYYRLDAKGAAGPAGPTGPAGGVTSVNGATGAVTLPTATTTAQGIVELATNTETTTGTDTTRAVTPAGVKAVGDTKQPLDTELTAIAGLTSAADRLPYFNGAGSAALATFTAAGRALVDDADAAAQRATLAAAASVGGGREVVAALSATTGTATGDCSAASIFTVTPTGNITLAFSNVPATGTSCAIRVIVTQGATVRTVTMPSGTKWIGAAAPTQIASKVCVIDLQTVDGGTTWLAGAGVEQ